MRSLLSLSLAAFFFIWSGGAFAQSLKTAILVDKKENRLHLTHYEDGELKLIKTYRATLGRVRGDKENEGDLKTPEGIYVAKGKQLPPKIAAKLGAMSFHLNFPNEFDRIAGRTGSGIMLHGTNEPDRLNKDFDSEGCVVVKNEEICEIDPSIRLGLTPFLIFDVLTPEYWKPGISPAVEPGQSPQPNEVKRIFDEWVHAWESRDSDRYIDFYHSDFVFSDKGIPMTKEKYREYKKRLTQIYASIEIGAQDVMILRHPKYSVVQFTQNYKSKLKGGGKGHASRGTKILTIAEELGKPKIVAESFSRLLW